jgi:hypothetical protein
LFQFCREVHFDPVAALFAREQSALRVEAGGLFRVQMPLGPEHVRAGERGVPAQIYFNGGREPAEPVAIAIRMEKGRFGEVHFHRDLRHPCVFAQGGAERTRRPDFPPKGLAVKASTWTMQRIAICYLAAAAIYLTTKIRGQIAWIVGLLTAYWLLMAFVPVPGYGAGRFDVEGNFAHYLDRIVLGAHNYRSTKTWDPEGIVSTLPAIATALFGVLCGHLLKARKALHERVIWMALAGALLLAAGLVCNIWLPINKKLWTTSFSLFMAGLDFVLFAAFLWLADGRGYKRALKPFLILGMNPITIYMISELLDELLSQTGLHKSIYRTVFAPIASPANASLFWALTYTGLMLFIAWIMYKRRWIVRI